MLCVTVLYTSLLPLFSHKQFLSVSGEVTAEELRQRLDGAKERLLAQPHLEPRPESSETHEENGGRGEEGYSWGGKVGGCLGMKNQGCICMGGYGLGWDI